MEPVDDSPKSSLTCPVVSATIVIDQMDAQGSVLRSTKHPAASLSLCRNERRELALHIDTTKRQLKVFLKDVTLHRRFLREGKATVVVQGQSLRLLISNAPPSQLLVFLRVLSAKLALQTGERPVRVRDRLLMVSGHKLDEISPLTAEQLGKLGQQQSRRAAEAGAGQSATGRPPLTARDTNVPTAGRGVKRPAAELQQTAKKPAKEMTVSRFLNPIQITKEQRAVLEVATSNRNIFFTGGAGTGKSFLLQRIIAALPPDTTWVTASTGAAACHLQGVTLHSFAGLGRAAGSLAQCVQLASRPAVLQQWRRCRHLVVDEISMVDADFFQKLEYVARQVRGNKSPFGGIHLVLCGDFLQLPPVLARSDKAGGGRFCFQSEAWSRCVDVTMELRQIHRQDDPDFIKILQNIRMGRCSEEDARRLSATAANTLSLQAGIAATRLCTHRADVDQINTHQLSALTGRLRQYTAEDSAGVPASLLDTLSGAPGRLQLRPGAQVMLTKNLDVRAGLVNGARGVVLGFSAATPFGGQTEMPEVQFASGARRVLPPERYTVKSHGGCPISRRQLPLRLAWAFSIHKSQVGWLV